MSYWNLSTFPSIARLPISHRSDDGGIWTLSAMSPTKVYLLTL